MAAPGSPRTAVDYADAMVTFCEEFETFPNQGAAPPPRRMGKASTVQPVWRLTVNQMGVNWAIGMD